MGFCWTSLSLAGPARAQWTNAEHLNLKLPKGLSLRSDLHFYISGETVSILKLNSAALELPLVSASSGFVTLSTSQLNPSQIDALIQEPVKIYTANSAGQIVDSTAVQLAGILDDLYAYTGDDLGPLFRANEISLKLWAPTAQRVRLFLYSSAETNSTQPLAILPLQRQAGVWSTTLPLNDKNAYYLYEVQVFHPATDQVETSLVTDPYSVGLSPNAGKTQLVDLNSPASKPAGWDFLQKPFLASLNSSTIYELHLRDFSALDATIPEVHRGTYLAFTHRNAAGVQHLQALSAAGLTHVHILPVNDFGSVNEDKKTWQSYLGPSNDQEEPQNIVNRIRSQDAYSWGYDPVHYFAPEGSYAVAQDGEGRVRELRTMVQSLSDMNLRVVQDVVFNHTYRSGTDPLSILDRIVPLYYYRLSDEGDIANSSCCSDTATENRMMEKLMIDALLAWAKNFKIDGFRFDLMSFHTHDNMVHAKQALRALTLDHDGVDGSKIILYGEGWVFGSLNDRAPQEAMTQLNSFGVGIGMFNDRLRDAVRGGTSDSAEKSDQGFVSGLYFDFNQEPANRNTPVDPNDQKEKLLQLGDIVKCALAGNLRDFTFREHRGAIIRAGDLMFRNARVANSSQTLETINYVAAHDGYTLWDAFQAKAPFYTSNRNPRIASIEDKRRMQQLALSFVLLGQGIPFMDAGSEILRSKSGDQDSYDSGDYFNAIDWTLSSNNWGKGLPAAWKNFNDWSFWSPRLKDPDLKVDPANIQLTFNYVLALFKVRQSTPLFQLNSLSDVAKKLSFIDNDSQAQPGLIAMTLKDSQQSLLIFFNASRDSRIFTHPLLARNWSLHPLFDERVDSALRQVVIDSSQQKISLPGRSTVILIGNTP